MRSCQKITQNVKTKLICYYSVGGLPVHRSGSALAVAEVSLNPPPKEKPPWAYASGQHINLWIGSRGGLVFGGGLIFGAHSGSQKPPNVF